MAGYSKWAIARIIVNSSSYAATSSYTPGGDGGDISTGSLVTTSSFNNFTGSYNTGSFTGSFTGSLFGTSSWANNAISASYFSGSISSAISSSYALSSSYASSASYVITASYLADPIIKSGEIPTSSFSGNPKTSAVTFTSPFPNNNYSINITGKDNRVWIVQSKTNSGFTVNSNSRKNLDDDVYWIAIAFKS